MIELFIFSIICATVASYQYRTIKKIDKLERRTTHKYEIIYYMLKDVMNEHRKKTKGE